MTMKERRRLAVLTQVQKGQITLVSGCEELGVSYRQGKRLYAAFKARGDAGLVHGLRGRTGNRRSDPALQERAVALVAEHYSDFGPTLAAEYLAKDHDLVVQAGTLRNWLIAANRHTARRRSRKKHQRRERRHRFGSLVQIDGSHHDWFEGRGNPCVAMVMVDDATNETYVRFFEGETTHAAMQTFRDWAIRYGLPAQLYPDRDSIYRVNTAEADEIEARTGKRPQTQFGRAMQELGVQVICAGSPQAKGRVERMNGTLQDRLVKAMRLAGIRDIASANAFLEEEYLAEHNARFAIPPANPSNAHQKVGKRVLEAAMCVRDDRKVSKDQCIRWQGKVLQLDPGKRGGSLADKLVQVELALDGSLRVRRGGKQVRYTVLEHRPKKAAASLQERVSGQAPAWKPAADHPWRKTGGGVRRESRPPLGPCSAAACSPTAHKPPLRKAPTAA